LASRLISIPKRRMARGVTKLSEPREIARGMGKGHEKRTDDFGDAANVLRKEFSKRTDDVRGAAQNLKEEYDKRLGQFNVTLSQSIEDSRHTVQKHPFLAVGVTLGVGVIAGVLLGRKSKA
jgi:ElaB/YqjD/DUF883 family membrane-anchored ribosome-binding protein